jgi:alcohol dehydrogenase
MRALVYHGPGQRGWDTVADPTIIDPTDIVVRIDTSTICGSDLHILKGDVPERTRSPGAHAHCVGGVRAGDTRRAQLRSAAAIGCT